MNNRITNKTKIGGPSNFLFYAHFEIDEGEQCRLMVKVAEI